MEPAYGLLKVEGWGGVWNRVSGSVSKIEVEEMSPSSVFIYTSDKMQRVKEVVDRVAGTDVTVLSRGERNG